MKLTSKKMIDYTETYRNFSSNSWIKLCKTFGWREKEKKRVKHLSNRMCVTQRFCTSWIVFSLNCLSAIFHQIKTISFDVIRSKSRYKIHRTMMRPSEMVPSRMGQSEANKWTGMEMSDEKKWVKENKR